MKKVAGLSNRSKGLLIIPLIIVFILAAVLLSTQKGAGEDTLSEALEGGELTLISIGRNNESLTQLVQNNETQASQLLDAARSALESAKAKLNSAKQTDDEYILTLLNNYEGMAQASEVMSQGVDNLLFISENLTNAVYYYSQENYEKAAEQSSYCLQILTPLLPNFEKSNTTLNGLDLHLIPAGQRDQLEVRIIQYRYEMKMYKNVVLLLESLKEGKAYLETNARIEEYMRQLQEAIANNDYSKAEKLRESISQLLQSLKDQQYQGAADTASQLDPNALSGQSSAIAQELQDKLRNEEGIDAFQNYLNSLEKYLNASNRFGQGDSSGAEQAIDQGLNMLGQNQGSDQDLQSLFSGLREAFNTLKLRIKSPPPPG